MLFETDIVGQKALQPNCAGTLLYVCHFFEVGRVDCKLEQMQAAGMVLVYQATVSVVLTLM